MTRRSLTPTHEWVSKLQQRAAFEAALAQSYLWATLSWPDRTQWQRVKAAVTAAYFQGASAETHAAISEVMQWDDT